MWHLINIVFIKNEETTCQIYGQLLGSSLKTVFSLLTQYEDSDLDWIKKKKDCSFVVSACLPYILLELRYRSTSIPP